MRKRNYTKIFIKSLTLLFRSDMPPMAAIFAIGSGSLAIPQLSEDFSEGARDFVHKCLTRYFFLCFMIERTLGRPTKFTMLTDSHTLPGLPDVKENFEMYFSRMHQYVTNDFSPLLISHLFIIAGTRTCAPRLMNFFNTTS